MAKREEAQRKRAEARRKRRDTAPAGGNDSDAQSTATDDEPLGAVKQAAKVAAAGAAVGAAAAAARALTHRGENGGREDEDVDTDEPQAEAGAAVEEPETENEHDEHDERDEQDEHDQPDERDEHRRDADRSQDQRASQQAEGANPGDVETTVQRARAQLEALLDRKPESVSALERTDDGWLVTLEVVEVSRIPESTDVLASYELELDDDRNLRRYARVRRYNRSQANLGDHS
jgi:gas vesicle protein GvpO